MTRGRRRGPDERRSRAKRSGDLTDESVLQPSVGSRFNAPRSVVVRCPIGNRCGRNAIGDGRDCLSWGDSWHPLS